MFLDWDQFGFVLTHIKEDGNTSIDQLYKKKKLLKVTGKTTTSQRYQEVLPSHISVFLSSNLNCMYLQFANCCDCYELDFFTTNTETQCPLLRDVGASEMFCDDVCLPKTVGTLFGWMASWSVRQFKSTFFYLCQRTIKR